MPAPTLSTVLDRIGQTQAPLSASTAVLIGLVVLALVLLPTWLVVQHVNAIAHEGAHALVGSSTGWKIDRVRLRPNGTGKTDLSSTSNSGRVVTGAAGYLGSSAFGLGAAKLISVGHAVAVLWLSLLLLAILLTMVRNSFGVFSVVITGFVLYLFARYAAAGTETVVAYVVAWFLLLSGLRKVVEHGPGAEDAGILAGITYIPRVLWCGIWLVGTTVALVLGGSLLV